MSVAAGADFRFAGTVVKPHFLPHIESQHPGAQKELFDSCGVGRLDTYDLDLAVDTMTSFMLTEMTEAQRRSSHLLITMLQHTGAPGTWNERRILGIHPEWEPAVLHYFPQPKEPVARAPLPRITDDGSDDDFVSLPLPLGTPRLSPMQATFMDQLLVHCDEPGSGDELVEAVPSEPSSDGSSLLNGGDDEDDDVDVFVPDTITAFTAVDAKYGVVEMDSALYFGRARISFTGGKYQKNNNNSNNTNKTNTNKRKRKRTKQQKNKNKNKTKQTKHQQNKMVVHGLDTSNGSTAPTFRSKCVAKIQDISIRMALGDLATCF